MVGPSRIFGKGSAAATLSTLLFLANVNAQQTIPNLNATAVNWPSSRAWEGNDGTWSTFFMHVGTPSQIVRVLPATGWQETWVISNQACAGKEPKDCYDLRGQTFSTNASSSWNGQGLFKTDLLKDLNYDVNGDYGLDRLGITNQDSGITFDDQVVVSVASDEWYLGIFGLGTQPTNFTDFNNPQPSFLTTMYNAGLIPSLSWGYQAGARYRNKGTPGSLIFGGYDTSRYIDNDIIFTQTGIYTVAFVVALSSVKVDGIYLNGQRGKAELLDAVWTRTAENQLISIDSATPYIWLPNNTCLVFEAALNLTWNEQAELYILTEEQHNVLLELNPTFTFTIADMAGNDTTLDITIPYSAFDLQASGPEILGGTGKAWYFPLKRMPEDGSARLGRAFMQEIYLFAEYHFNEFRVFQADWNGGAANIETHLPVKLVAAPGGGGGKSSTNIGAIVGGVVGGVAVIAAIAGGLWFWRRKKNQQGGGAAVESGLPGYDQGKGDTTGGANELDGGVTKMPTELGGAGVATAAAWEGKGGYYENSSHQNQAAVHEVHGQTAEKTWNEADGTPILRPNGEQFAQRPHEHAAPTFYAELESGDVITPMSGGAASAVSPLSGPATPAHELPSGETRREGN